MNRKPLKRSWIKRGKSPRKKIIDELDKICLTCNKVIIRRKNEHLHEFKARKYCSHGCYLSRKDKSNEFQMKHYAWNKGKTYHTTTFPIKICPTCHKEFRTTYNRKIQYCSRQCLPHSFKKGHKVNLGEKYPNRTKEKHPNWKGGKFYSNGYIHIYCPKHPFARHKRYMCEHRLIIEKQIGRYLTQTEQIHHINGVKDDNRIENLLLCKDRKEHQNIHAKMETLIFKLIRKGRVYYDKEKKEFMEAKN